MYTFQNAKVGARLTEIVVSDRDEVGESIRLTCTAPVGKPQVGTSIMNNSIILCILINHCMGLLIKYDSCKSIYHTNNQKCGVNTWPNGF